MNPENSSRIHAGRSAPPSPSPLWGLLCCLAPIDHACRTHPRGLRFKSRNTIFSEPFLVEIPKFFGLVRDVRAAPPLVPHQGYMLSTGICNVPPMAESSRSIAFCKRYNKLRGGSGL